MRARSSGAAAGPQVDELLGLDIAEAAIDRARQRSALFPNLHFEQADLLELPRSLHHRFNLVLLVDTLYYLSPLDDETLKQVAMRVADLLVPGGLCVLVNHYFFAADSDSRTSRRIHRAFSWSSRFRLDSEHRKPFFLASLLTEQLDLTDAVNSTSNRHEDYAAGNLCSTQADWLALAVPRRPPIAAKRSVYRQAVPNCDARPQATRLLGLASAAMVYYLLGLNT